MPMKILWPKFIRKFRDRQILAKNLLDRITTLDQNLQLDLKMNYRQLAHQGIKLPFSDVEFRCFSQSGEDGIIHYIFSLIGTTNKIAVEACAATGIECCTANLFVNHGWHGLLLDGNEHRLNKGRAFYAANRSTKFFPPILKTAWITAENINQLLRESGIEGEIDLLSLDLDGNDYWIWKALDVVSPRVIVLEYNDVLDPRTSVTIPYDPKFIAQHQPHGPIYFGASLGAFVKLGKEKGYRYVGSQSYGFNAFFIRNDVAPGEFPEQEVPTVSKYPRAMARHKAKYPYVQDRPWIKV